ncbi:IgA peptidase M64-domain-containing protein [Phellopilus nigrolimitatus]|nr:IgA peptidase M64-domain-containing protein [Phellopilus nigrolimitatus]
MIGWYLLQGSSRGPDGEFVLYFSFDLDLLWTKAISFCGSPTSWSFPVYVAPEVRQLSKASSIKGDDGGQLLFASNDYEDISLDTLPPSPPLEILPLIATGPSSNRVDLVFFGDGYIAEEREKFIRDARNLALDISNNQTFATVKPLMNFWAAFTPSKKSGIGAGGEANDTPFGLYRDGTELRAVYYAKPEVAHAACLSMGDKCDYPILLGLGGRFTVTTSSEINGALVLRHELGHSLENEGEEYDGGFAYYGPNAANLTQPFKWAHWLTAQTTALREERSVMPMQAYPWSLLNISDPWVVFFDSSGLYSRHVVRFSLSGLPRKEDLIVKLDGTDLEWTSRTGIGLDRWHYDIHGNYSLRAGSHSLTFSLENAALADKAQLCSAEVIEYGNEDEFNSSVGFIGAFPTWSDRNTTTYRPTNEGCLMRIVTTPNFCKVCTEGLWHALLKRVDLVDEISLGCAFEAQSLVRRVIEIRMIGLAQFREETVSYSEAYVITWKRNGTELPQFANQTSISVDNHPATFTVQVQFVTDEVRVDPHGYLESTLVIDVEKCEVGVP